ncbi:hypothetical protein [Legionella sp. km772]|uniref:hypothetical protein n=1 Tax=Legionella sp. km772 TaxID=2498111 RepID=UPI000F8C8286|nr:hypothetical protein [Legionella sp. km772]RUR09723.1 hypothetical protein ELY15_08890 [Legionella sp. km772]
MPFFASTREFLNQQTGYLVNWNRPGSLFFGNHRYSNRELLERGFVIASTAVGGFLAANKSEHGGVVPFAFGASLAFLLAHTVTMSPLIYKRLKAKWACEELIKKLNAQNSDELRPLISLAINEVMNHAPVKSPSAVWGKRLRLLQNLDEWINNNDPSLLLTTLKEKNLITLLEENNLTARSTLTT